MSSSKLKDIKDIEEANEQITVSRPIKKSKKLFYLFVVLIILIFVVGGLYIAKGFGYIGFSKTTTYASKQGEVSKDDKVILDQLSKIILLPKDVIPTMAIITDVDKLQKQQPDFFVDAKNGQRLIVYPTMAIIFDVQANKIMKVGPVQVAQPQTTPVYFAVYNGSGTAGKGKTMETKIRSVFNNAEVKIVDNAVKNDYPKTLLIDLTGKNTDMDKIAVALGAQVSTLPEGEVKPDGVSFIMIVGKD